MSIEYAENEIEYRRIRIEKASIIFNSSLEAYNIKKIPAIMTKIEAIIGIIKTIRYNRSPNGPGK